MIKIFKILKEFFSTDEPNGDGFENDVLKCNYTKEKILDILDIRKKSIDNALNEIPRTDAIQIDNVESSITQYINNEIIKITGIINDKTKNFTNSLKSYGVKKSDVALKNISEIAKKKINSVISDNENTLKQLHDTYVNTKNDLDNFRIKHNLKHEPHYPISKYYSISFLILIVIIESIFNGYFFSKGSDAGWVGGILISFSVSFVNIFIAVVIAGMILMRYINHSSVFIKTVSWFFLIIYFILMATFNLGIAHYRDSYSIQSEGAFEVAKNSFLTSPFNLMEIESWLLFLLGIIFAFVGAYKGSMMDDRFPGYGRLHRRVEDTWQDFNSELTSVKEEIEFIKTKFKKKLEDLQNEVNHEFEGLFLFFQEIELLPNQYQLCRSKLEQFGFDLISETRTINLKHRKTEAPQYYNDKWEVDGSIKSIKSISYKSEINKQEVIRDKFPELLKCKEKEIYDLYDDAITKLNKYQKFN